MGLFSFGGNTQQDADDEQTPVRPRRSRAPEEEPMDPMLPEKKRARRRLIGATALVLAAVIGLPMIFDSEPRPISQDIAIQIPPRDKAPPMNASPMPLPPAPAASASRRAPVLRQAQTLPRCPPRQKPSRQIMFRQHRKQMRRPRTKPRQLLWARNASIAWSINQALRLQKRPGQPTKTRAATSCR